MPIVGINVPGISNKGSVDTDVLFGTLATPVTTTANQPGVAVYAKQTTGAGNNLGIGMYSEAHIAGSLTDHTYGGGFWINFDSGTQTAGTILSPMDNGIYQAGGTLTSTNVFFGGRLEGIVTDAPTIFSPFSLNTNNRSITSLFDGAAAPSVGLVDGAVTGTVTGKVPLVSVNGSVRWVRVYTTLS